ncbi:MAG TPA: 50S ribosomal protein L29 [Candidatus Angelobacter sp.]|jgi:large subunit ribosomal protein L29|nr:50S ribosomal protein L29 [Candidatus Angelobacter sp.]
MDVEKLRSLTDAELLHQQQELNDQLFRLKFQLKMGQTESLNKIRGLRKDVARVHTVAREKQLGLVVESHHPAASAAGDATAAAKPAKKAAAGKGAKRKAKPAAPAKSKAAAAKSKKAKPAKKKTATAAKRKK